MDFILTPTGTVTLSGYVYNAAGQPLPNQVVGGATTDANGFYSFQAVPGLFPTLYISGTGNDPSLEIPPAYEIYIVNFSLTQNTRLDFTIPAVRVAVHVQDPANAPLGGVAVSAETSNGSGPYGGFANTGSLNLGNGFTAYARNTNSATTDASGDAAMWLLPNDTWPPDYYNFTATPPSGSFYNPFTVSGVRITGSQTEIISLQYSHNPPTTTASVSPDPSSDGTYPNPATVTLSAIADTGFTIANTYFTVDGGMEQVYSGPFEVPGAGPHVIGYWSVDSSGLYETPKTLTFEIVSNKPPTADAGGPYAIAEGGELALDASASSDPDGDALTYAWDVNGDGDFSDATGVNPTLTWAQLVGLGIDDGPADSHANLRVKVSDGKADPVTSAAVALTVENAPPGADFTAAPKTLDEGGTFALSLTNPTDPSSVDAAAGFSYAFDCGDGNGYGLFGPDATATCPTNEDGTRAVKGAIRDKDGGTTEYAGTVTIANVDPTARFEAPTDIDEGGTATLQLHDPADPSSDDAAAGFHYAFACHNGDLSGKTYANTGPEDTTVCDTYPDNEDAVTVKGRIIDKNDGFTEYTATLVVHNVDPTATFQAPDSVDEGDAITLTLADPQDAPGDLATLEFLFDCGDGHFVSAGTSNSYTCPPTTDNGTVPVRGQVRDKDGGQNTYADQVVVNNVDPTVAASFAAAIAGCGLQNATLDVQFTDPGTADTFTATVDWGDGTVEDLGAVTSPFEVTHTYATAGQTSQATVTVTDDDGGAGMATTDPGFTVAYTIADGGFQPPLSNSGPNVAKYGSTIPVKVIVLDCDGVVVNGLELRITLVKIANSAPPEDITLPESTSAADTTGYMRDAGNHYEYNLATKPLDGTATYQIVVTITQTGQQVTTTFGLK